MYRSRLYALFHTVWGIGLISLLSYNIYQSCIYQNNYWYALVILTSIVLILEISIIYKELSGFKAFSLEEENYLYGTIRDIKVKRTGLKYLCQLQIETTGSADVTLNLSSWINYFYRWRTGHLIYRDGQYIAVLPKSIKGIKFQPLTLLSWLKKGKFSPIYRQ